MRTVRCNGCRAWFSAKAERCDHCGMLRPSHNVALLSQRFINRAHELKAKAIADG